MLNALFTKIFGSRNDRVVKKMGRVVDQVGAFEEALKALSDDALKAKTTEFRERFKGGEALDDLLPEAFAVVREASVRALGMRHYDVQLIGGIVLHQGMISEMKTGEGKTLMATLAGYLNALSGNSVHVVTVNDYLASRDADWMRPIYTALDMEVGVVVPGGFGERGMEGKIATVRWARENNVPYLGLCLGLQVIIIDLARHALGSEEPNSTEFDPRTRYPVIDLMADQRTVVDMGGTMRLGLYPCHLAHGTNAAAAYGVPHAD